MLFFTVIIMFVMVADGAFGKYFVFEIFERKIRDQLHDSF